jgi:hypothetical protein
VTILGEYTGKSGLGQSMEHDEVDHFGVRLVITGEQESRLWSVGQGKGLNNEQSVHKVPKGWTRWLALLASYSAPYLARGEGEHAAKTLKCLSTPNS